MRRFLIKSSIWNQEAIVVPRIDHLDQPVIIIVGTEENKPHTSLPMN